MESVKLRWIQALPTDIVDACVKAVLSTPILADPGQVSYSDVTLLVDSHKIGLQCVQRLNRMQIGVEHIFSDDKKERRSLKKHFFMGDARVKACTIHSFKGWESRCLVVCVTEQRSISSRSLIYVALSRLKKNIDGSFLTVVCSAPEFEEFGSSWPSFEGVGNSEEIDLPF